MIKHKFIVALFTLCYLLTACVAEDLQGPVAGSGEGYLVLQVGSVSAEVQSAPLTKATTTLTELGVTLPSEDEFTITIKDSNGSTVKTGLYESLKSSPIVLPKGTYTVEASQGDTLAIQDKPYFYGSGSVTITTGSNTISLSPKLANAIITPVVSEGLSKHYNNWTLNACIGTDTKELATSSNANSHLFAKKGEMVSFIFSGTNKLGIQTSSTWNMSNAIDACMNYRVQCDPTLSICSAITVKGTIDPIISDGWLRGSELTLSYSVANDADTSAISSWHVDVKYNNITIRTYDSSAPNGIKMEQNLDWPYIPKDSEITAYVTIAGDQIPVNTTKVANPISFGIDVTAETTYSLYQSQGAAAANEKDGSSIFNIGSTVKIAQEILNNSNYAHMLPKVSYTTDTGQNSGELAYNTPVSDFSGLNWQKHVLTATATFDGATVSNSQDCHVTGLPYTADPLKKDGAHPWTIDQENWGIEYFTCNDTESIIYVDNLSGDNIIIGSPKFHVPGNYVPINIGISAHGYYLSKYTYNDITVKIHTSNSSSTTFKVDHNKGAYKDYLIEKLSLDNSLSKIQIENTHLGGGHKLYIKTVQLNYR